MTLEFEYLYTTELARLASRRYMRRAGRTGLVIVLVLILIAAIRILNGIDDALTICLFAVPFAYAWLRYSYLRRGEHVAARMRDPRVTITADADTLTFRTTEQVTTRAWRAIEEVWQFADVWLLFPYGSRGGAPTPIPTSALSTEAQAFIGERLLAHGAKVVRG